MPGRSGQTAGAWSTRSRASTRKSSSAKGSGTKTGSGTVILWPTLMKFAPGLGPGSKSLKYHPDWPLTSSLSTFRFRSPLTENFGTSWIHVVYLTFLEAMIYTQYYLRSITPWSWNEHQARRAVGASYALIQRLKLPAFPFS